MTRRQLFMVALVAACPIYFIWFGQASRPGADGGLGLSAAEAAPNDGAAMKAGAARIFVDAGGDDTTGVRGQIDKPFATLEAAYKAKGVAAGDLIYLGPGTFKIATTQLIPNGVSVWGSGQGITNLAYTGSGGLMMQPGSNSTFGNLSIVNGTGNPIVNFFPIGFDLLAGGSKEISTDVTVVNLTVSTFSDGFFFNGKGITTTPCYWKLINCTVSTGYDCVTIIPADDNAPGPKGAWPFRIDLVNCFYNVKFIDKSAANCRGLHIEGPIGYGGPVVRDFGGVFNINGNPADNKPTHAVSATNVTIELHGSTIVSDGASHLYSSGEHGLIKVGTDSDFDPKKITTVGGGKVTGYLSSSWTPPPAK